MTTDGEGGAQRVQRVLMFFLFVFLQRDLTGSNLSVNTERSNLPMTNQCPLHPACA